MLTSSDPRAAETSGREKNRRACAPDSALDRWSQRMRRLGLALLTIGAAAFVVVWFKYLFVTYVDFPVLDNWVYHAHLAENYATRNYSYLWAQVNEHRIFLHKLVYLIDYRLFDFSNVFSYTVMMVAYLTAAVLAIAQGVRLVASAREPTVAAIVLAGTVSVFLVFTLRQWETFYGALNVGNTMAGAMFFAALALYRKWLVRGGRLRDWPLWVAAVALSLGATGTMAFGFFILPFLVLFDVLHRRWNWRQPVMLAIVGLCFAVYTWDYNFSPAQPGEMANLGRDVFRIIRFALTVPGGFFVADTELAPWVGFLGVALTAWMAVDVVRRWMAGTLTTAYAAVAVTTGFFLLYALLVGVGRRHTPYGAALAARYSLAMGFFWQALICLILYRVSDEQRGLARLYRQGAAALAVLAILPAVFWDRTMYAGTTSLKYKQTIAINALMVGVYDVGEFGPLMVLTNEELIDLATHLRRANTSFFARREARLIGYAISEAYFVEPSGCSGSLNSVAVLPTIGGFSKQPLGWKVFGWAWDTKRDKQPDSVVLTDSSRTIVGSAVFRFPTPQLAALHDDADLVNAGWIGHAAVRPGERELHAYAVSDGGRFACEVGKITLPLGDPLPQIATRL